MSTVFGYCRISRKTQSIERQIRNIKDAYPDAVIVQEAYTGTRFEGREKFERLCKTVKSGDTIVFDSVSRMSRNAEEGFAQYMAFFAQGVELVFLKEPPINTEAYKAAMDTKLVAVKTGDDAADSLVNGIMEAVNAYMLRLAEKQIKLAFEQAQKEVDDNHQRTVEGLVTAKINGKQIGQQAGRKLNVKKAAAAKEIIRKHSKDFGGSLSDPEVIKLAGISRNSFYKYKAELKQDETEV